MSTDLHIYVGTENSDRNKAWSSSVVGVEKRYIHFGNFKDLPFDEDIESPIFSCFGKEWKFAIRKQRDQNNIDTFKMTIYPCPGCSKHILIGSALVSGYATKKHLAIVRFRVGNVTEGDTVAPIVTRQGIPAAVLEEQILFRNILTFVLEMRLNNDDRIMNFRGQECPLRQSMLNILSDQDTADISFNIKGRLTNVHLAILKSAAPDFVRTLNLDEHNNSEHVHIEDIDPDIFETMIEFIYGGTIYISDHRTAKKIIDAADKYGVGNLKIEAEKKYVDYIDFTAENIVDELLYADAKNCMSVKKAAMDFLMDNMDDVVETTSLKRLYLSESVTNELMLSLSKRRKFNGE